MDKKDYIYLPIIVVLVAAGVVTTVYDTGEEITCKTNKPHGWDVVAEHDGYYEAVCPYVTKEWVYADCSSFRSTASYERYGCNEVIVVEGGNPVTAQTSSGRYVCRPEGCTQA